MAKRTGNSSVNSSIRQQTRSNEEGLSQLIVLQQQSVGHLATIKSLMETTANIKDDERLKLEQESLDVQKKQLIVLEDSEADRKKAQEDIQKLMDSMKTFKSPLEKGKGIMSNLAGKFSGENIKTKFLESTNVFGINNKRLEKDKFIKEQKALGAEGDLNKKFEGAYAAKKESSKVEESIQKIRQATGGKFTDEELAKSKPETAALFAKKAALTQEYAQFDKGAALKTGGKAAMVSPAAEAVAKTPTQLFASEGEQLEEASENAKLMGEQTSLLTKIEENTRGSGEGAPKAKPVEPASKGGLLDGIFDFLGTGLMTAFKTLFSPKNLLKALGKIFVIGAIVGALFSGITDAFDEFAKSGDIGKALIAGLAGIVDFLTFGLFDKEKIKEVIGDFATWTSENLIQPFVKFITGIKDDFMAMISSIGIPEIKFKIPVINKEVAIGPFYPFKSDSSSSAPTAPPPTTAAAVAGASKENADAEAANTGTGGGNTAVVNAPVTTNNNTSQVIKSPIRNQESSMSKFVGSRYARA